MLSVVRRHHMALNPDAVRYLKAVLTAEALVKELIPSSTCEPTRIDSSDV